MSGTSEGQVLHDLAVHAMDGGMPPRALCGAGMLVQRIPDWFNPADPDACAACVVAHAHVSDDA
jgi:hypothetical protein